MKSEINKIIKRGAAVLLLLLLWGLQNNIHAQVITATPPLSPKLDALSKPQSTINWLDFREGTQINPSTIFIDLKDAFELKDNDQMKVQKIKTDDLGFKHYQYQQYYKNIKVMYGEYLVHQRDDGFVQSANGNLVMGINAGNTASVSEKRALEAALTFMNAKKYLWQNNDLENALKVREKNTNATYLPKGELVYSPAGVSLTSTTANYKLAWHFKIYTDDPGVRQEMCM